MSTFDTLGLDPRLMGSLKAAGYETPTPIQAQAIPQVISGRDLLGIAQTGTGKTVAFALPIIHRLLQENKRPARGSCRCLVLSPTRELASQIAEDFRSHGRPVGLSTTVVFGGVGFGPQAKAIANGVDILVATPGRLIDHLQQRTARLDGVSIFVLDEADQMLDLGFIVPIRRIVKTMTTERQNLFFSATMPQAIGELAGELLRDPVKVAVAPEATTVERVEQRVIFIEGGSKRALLVETLADPALERVLVFARTKHGADKVARHLEKHGVVSAPIHGNRSQAQRERALAGFKHGAVRVLVATDIAARGIDVSGVSHVINLDLPNVPESYVHRIGRTARAGAAGIAISFCANDERPFLRDIERLIRMKIPAENRMGDEALREIARATASDGNGADGEDYRDSRRPHGNGGGRGQPRREGGGYAGRGGGDRSHHGDPTRGYNERNGLDRSRAPDATAPARAHPANDARPARAAHPADRSGPRREGGRPQEAGRSQGYPPARGPGGPGGDAGRREGHGHAPAHAHTPNRGHGPARGGDRRQGGGDGRRDEGPSTGAGMGRLPFMAAR